MKPAEAYEPKPPPPYIWQRHSFSGTRWPRSRSVRSFLLLVPWIDLVIAALLLFFLTRQTVVQPGRIVELPEAAAEEGLLARNPTAVIRRLVAPGRSNVSVLLLDEGRYPSDNPTALEALKQVRPGTELNLIIDRDIAYGEAISWVERLRACGAERINLVAPPAPESPERGN